MISQRQKQSLILVCILAFAFFTRAYRVYLPTNYMFDEVYHAVTAKLIARNDPRAFEWWNPPVEPHTAVDWLHPPLAKYTQAVSMLIFGENSFGWRFSSVVFGTLVIFLIYKLTEQVTRSKNMALLAAFLSSLDGLLLVQSRIAMNDIHVTAAILFTLFLYAQYLEKKKFSYLFATGIMAGVSMATKWSGVFTLGIIWSYEVLSYLLFELKNRGGVPKRITRFLFFFLTHVATILIIPVVVYVCSYFFMFYQGKDMEHFQRLHEQIWWYQTHLEATHPYQSRPYQWFLDIRPVWMNVEYGEKTRSDVYAFGNPALFWLGGLSIILSVLVGIGISLRGLLHFIKAKQHSLQQFFISGLTALLTSPLVFFIFSYSCVWMPWQFSPRIMFFYHYTPAVPLLTSVLSYWLITFWKASKIQTIAVVLSILSILVCFIVWYPHWIGLPMPIKFINAVYFALPQWE